MKSKKCLYCYQSLAGDEEDFHERCSRKFFGTSRPPVLDYTREQMEELAREIVIRSIAVTGAQPKLSLTIEKTPADPRASRLTIVGLWGEYILKPPTREFPHLPENEDLTMHLSESFGINTAAHSLIRLKSGELAYITRRFDRQQKEKLALEDMCQLTETLTEDKYRSSMEKVGKQISRFSSRKGFDLIGFFEMALFSYLTGNADMHLKNFALLTTPAKEIVLASAYDMVSTKIAMPEDRDEMALTVNGRKRKITRADFDALASSLQIPDKSLQNSYAKASRSLREFNEWIDLSFLPVKLKTEYKQVIMQNAEKMQLLA